MPQSGVSVLAPYLQARQRRVSGLQQLLQRREGEMEEFKRQKALKDYGALLEQAEEERKQRALAEDPMRKAQMSALETLTRQRQYALEHPQPSFEEKLKLQDPYRRGLIEFSHQFDKPAASALKASMGNDPDWTQSDIMLDRLKYLRSLDRLNRGVGAKGKALPDPLTTQERAELNTLEAALPQLMRQRAFIASRALGTLQTFNPQYSVEMPSDEETPQDDLDELSIEDLLELFR